jgi:prepilin-type N-terminal cleavage/methylation domain-containing protein
MLARIRKAQEEREGGFTLIELLVVMIIIGILAAIAIPVFLNQRAKARDTSTKADVSTVGKELATYYVDGAAGTPSMTQSGQTVTLKVGAATVTTIRVSQGTSIPAANAASGTSDSDWCVALTNTNGSQKYYSYSAANGLGTANC